MIPIPDAIREDETKKDRVFVFDPGPPNIDLKERTMTAPVELSERTRELQLLELAHAKWSPLKMTVAGIDRRLLESVEHNRLIHRLLIAGFEDLNCRFYNDADIEYAMKYSDVFRATSMFISSFNTADHAQIANQYELKYGALGNLVRSELKQFNIEGVHHQTWGPSFGWDEAVDVARRVQKLLQEFLDNKLKLDDQPPPAYHPMQPSDTRIASSLIPDSAGSGARYWMPMEIQEPPRPVDMKVDLKTRKTIKSETGAVPIAMYRACIDGRVFRAKRRIPAAGSVLIDQSGSMRMTDEDVANVMEHLPAVVIAGYCAENGQGWLRILAKNGRRVEDDNLIIGGGQNGVDGPALEWLTTQPGPRFWVSDGGVTGIGALGDTNERPVSQGLRREINRLQIRGRILRVPDCGDLVLELARAKQRA